MIKNKKKIVSEEIPEFKNSLDSIELDSKIFVEKSLEIAHYIYFLMEQKGLKQKDLAERMGKSEAEVSKVLSGMHNLTLRSIAKIESALGATVICTPHRVLAISSFVKKKYADDIAYKISDEKVISMHYASSKKIIQNSSGKNCKSAKLA